MSEREWTNEWLCTHGDESREIISDTTFFLLSGEELSLDACGIYRRGSWSRREHSGEDREMGRGKDSRKAHSTVNLSGMTKRNNLYANFKK